MPTTYRLEAELDAAVTISMYIFVAITTRNIMHLIPADSLKYIVVVKPIFNSEMFPIRDFITVV